VTNTHRLTFRTESRYARRICPVERRQFRPGEEIVVCPACDTAYTVGGWDYVGGRCPICGYSEEVSPPLTVVITPALSPGAWLYLIEGYKGEGNYRLRDTGDTRIGRDPDNDIVLDSNFVSGRHALIRGNRGVFTLHDLASTNGTWLNGHRIYRSILYDGDVLTFGDRISLVFKQVRNKDTHEDSVK